MITKSTSYNDIIAAMRGMVGLRELAEAIAETYACAHESAVCHAAETGASVGDPVYAAAMRYDGAVVVVVMVPVRTPDGTRWHRAQTVI